MIFSLTPHKIMVAVGMSFALLLPASALASTQMIMGMTNAAVSPTFPYSLVGMGPAVTTATTHDVFPVSGTLSNFYAYVDVVPGGSATRTFTVRKFQANTSVTCTISSASQTCTDSSDTIAVSAGDSIDVQQTVSGTPGGAHAAWSMTFTPTNANDTVLTATDVSTGSVYRYESWNFTSLANIVNIPSANLVMPEGGTLDMLIASSSTNLSSGSYTFSAFQNSATSSLACTITVRGCTDNVDTLTLSTNDTIAASLSPSSPSGAFNGAWGARFVPTTSGDFDFFGSTGFSGDVAGSTRYLPLSLYSTNPFSVEASSTMVANAATTFTSMTLLRSAAPGSGKTATYTLRVNGVDSALTCSLTGTGSGDGITTKTCTGSVSINPGDLLDISDTLTSAGTAGTSKVSFVATQSSGGGSGSGSGSDANALTKGLVGWWTFDGPDLTDKVYDRSGQNNNGYFIDGATSSAKVIGKVGQALRFVNGSDQLVNVAQASSINDLTNKTITAWIKPSSAGQNNLGTILGKYSATGWMFRIEDSFGTAQVDLYQTFSGNDGEWDCLNSFSYNKWTFVAVTYNDSSTGNTPTFNVNGTSCNGALLSPPTGSVDSDSSTVLTVGNNSGKTLDFDGTIDEVRIYNRVLSAQDILQLYKQGQATYGVNPATKTIGLTSGLVSYWTFDGKDTNWLTGIETDKSGNANSGSLTNMSTSTTPTAGKIGQALGFAGTAQYVFGTNTINTSAATVSAWVYVTSYVASNAEVVAGFTQGDGGGVYDKDIILDSAGKPYFYYNNGSSLCTSVPASGISQNAWHLLTAVVNASSGGAIMYVDGQSVGTNAGSGSYAGYTGADFGVGVTTSGAGATACNGSPTLTNRLKSGTRVDDVRVYNRVLSAQEITQLYKQGQVTYGVNPATKTIGLTSGLVGYWSFNGKNTHWSSNTTDDLSGQGNTGTMANMSTSTSPAIGKVGQGVRFDGSGNAIKYIYPASAPSLDANGSWTYSIWIKPSTYTNGSDVSGNGTYFLDRTTATQGLVSLKAVNDNYTYQSRNDAGANYQGIRTTSGINLNQWTHIVLVRAFGTGFYIYKNGVQEGFSSNGASDTLTPPSFALGTSPPGASSMNNMTGSLDEFRIYNRVLSAQEITQLYKQGTSISR